MSTYALGLAVAALLVACSISPSPSPTRTTSRTTSPSGPSAQVDAAVAARLDAALETGLADLGVPGVQAAVVFDDGSVWVGAAGESTTDRPMTSDLLMPLASVTKVYTATLVLDLADDGVVDLDDPVTRWLPDAAYAEGVNLRQLLTHTSGIASDDPTFPSVCAPGTCYSYSNGGYQVLGQVIEAATGATYAAALRERILAPLDLVATFYPREEAATGEEAIGRWQGEEQAAIAAATFGEGPGWLGASGGIVATAEDAARFADALFDSRVLTAANLAALNDIDVAAGLPGAIDCDPAAMIGRRQTAFGETRSHGGNAGSFRAWLEHYPAFGLSVVVLVNANNFGGPIADGLVAAALEGETAPGARGRCEDAIAIRDAEGTVRRLPDVPGFDGMPAWSPDGAQLAWLIARDGRTDVVVARADGSNVRHVTDDAAHDVRASWSPDGVHLAFSSGRDGDFEVYVLRLADGATSQLTHNGVDDWLPAWSPDGGSIAFIRTEGGANELRVLNVADGTDRVVDGPGEGVWWPAWAPDSSRLAYEAGGVIFIVPATGGEPTRLAVERLRVVGFPAWAPSEDLVFVSDGDLYAAAVDGSDLRRLTETSIRELTPAWSPDGATLAFQLSYWVDGDP